MPFSATSLRPLKKLNFVGSVGEVLVSESIASMTTCEWPLTRLLLPSACGAAKKFVFGLTKKPVLMFWIASCTVKFVFAWTVSRFFGKTNFAEGMAVVAAIMPIGAPLHEPVLICVPFVRGRFVVAQKLMKLLSEVAEATWPASESLESNQRDESATTWSHLRSLAVLREASLNER